MKVGFTENKDDESEDTPCDERKKTSFQHFKKGSKRVDTIPVPSVFFFILIPKSNIIRYTLQSIATMHGTSIQHWLAQYFISCL